MCSSPGFGSSPCDERRLSLAFTTCNPQSGLHKPHRTNSLARSTKSTLSPRLAPGLQLFVSVWFQVLFHLPYRDTFHLSLTVLVHYRSEAIFSLGRLVLPDSDRISPVLPYLRTNLSISFLFMYRTITLYGRSFQRRSIKKTFWIPK
jgi:hypothetical protein